VVEVGGWPDGDGSRRVRHEIFGEIPYPTRQLLTPFFWHVSTGVKPESKGGRRTGTGPSMILPMRRRLNNFANIRVLHES
jgi:hypothetical protein